MSDEKPDETYIVPAPVKEDVLFRLFEGIDILGDKWGQQWLYHSAFKLAAKRLADSTTQQDRASESLVYPIIYLYRHYFELVLKAIIEACLDILDRSSTRAKGHNLEKLWQTAQPLLEPVCLLAGETPYPLEEMAGVASYISQIHALDPDGAAFRYPDAKDTPLHAQEFPNSNKQIEYSNDLWSGLDKLANYLEQMEAWLTYVQDAKLEYQLKYANNISCTHTSTSTAPQTPPHAHNPASAP